MSATQPYQLPSRLLALGAVTSVEFVENGMVMFAASQVMAGLGLSAHEFAFAYTLYGVAAIFMLYKHQWMVERLGYRRFVLLSLAVFGAGSVLCALAGSLGPFALGRFLQGLGGATFFTAGRMAINDLPEEARFRGTLVFVGSLLGGSAAAPFLAALLMEGAGWRGIFWFGLPQALTVAWLAAPHLSRAVTAPGERSREHWGWLLWLCVGVFCLQYAIVGVETAEDRLASLASLAGIALASLAMLTLFAWRQWRNERPLINYRGLFQFRYLFGLVLYFAGYFMIGASGLMVPILLHGIFGVPLLLTAAIVSAGMLGTMGMALGHLALARRWPRHRLYMLSGLALYGAGSLGLALADSHGQWPRLLPAILALYLAIPWFLGPVAFGTFTQLHARVFSHGYQVKNIVRQLGLSSSIAVVSLALHGLGQGADPLPAWLGLPPAGGGIAPQLLASKEVFALLAAAVVPVSLTVLVQRVFR